MKKIFFILIVTVVGGAAAYLPTIPTMVYPTPYLFKNTFYPDAERAADAKILFIGDRMGTRLNNHIPIFKKEVSKGLNGPLDIFNWSEKNEGLHRSLDKLKHLKKLPKIVIYHGTSEEFSEKKFNLRDTKKFFANFKTFEDKKKLSLMTILPLLSKVLYKKLKYVPLTNDIKPLKMQKINSFQRQKMMEISYKLFQIELLELINLTQNNGTQLIVLTAPINLDQRPKGVCQKATSGPIEKEQVKIEKLLDSEDSKMALRRAIDLTKKTISNSLSYYLLGQAHKNKGHYQKAKIALELASAYDCSFWRSNAIFNNIIRKITIKQNVILIDFDNMVNESFGTDAQFIGPLYPQSVYYKKLMSELVKNARKILNI
jgi:hypothetical protein